MQLLPLSPKQVISKAYLKSSIQMMKYDQKMKTLYGNSFEWRFEFPEVLDEEGSFTGFDAVIGNPPYIRHESISAMKDYQREL